MMLAGDLAYRIAHVASIEAEILLVFPPVTSGRWTTT